MDDVLPMCDGKGLANLRADLGGLALVDRAALLDGGLQIAAAHELHDDVVRAVVLTPVVHVDDVGALEVRLQRPLPGGKRRVKSGSAAYCGSMTLTATRRPSTLSCAR